MQSENTNKEKFNRMANKAFDNKEKYDFIRIIGNKTKAFLDGSEESDIRNAIILLKQSEVIREWEIKNYKVLKCPQQLYVCIKNLKVLLGCSGNPNDESSYFEIRIIKKRETTEKSARHNDMAIFGVVEVNECVSVFYYNCATMESWYINQPSFEAGDTEMYKLIEGFRYMEGLLNERRTGELENGDILSEKNWQDNQWKNAI